MLRISKSFITSYTNEQMYSLINDINSYKYFLPKCKDSRVIYETNDTMEAVLVISTMGKSYKFTTKNYLSKPKTIKITLLEGPFKSLQGCWTFTSENLNGCKIQLDLEIQMQNSLAQLALRAVLDIMTEIIFNSFKSRADTVFQREY